MAHISSKTNKGLFVGMRPVQPWTGVLTFSPFFNNIGLMTDILKHRFAPNLRNIYDETLINQLALTQGAIGSLSQLKRLLHNPDLLMSPILGKEAESSSQLEGTQASIEDVYQIDILEQSSEKRNEAMEIVNYERAMYAGLSGLEKSGLTETTIRGLHKTLLAGVRGKDKSPGAYRKDQVWIGKEGTGKGKARYIPPDAIHVPKLMEVLQKFIQSRGSINPIIASGIIHQRFEAIHPFKDGNGRIGRLLITLYLMKEGLLNTPILYPSGYFEEHRKEYMDNLSKVDKEENWYPWLLFYLKALKNQAELSLDLGLKIDDLYKKCRSKIEDETAGLKLITVLEYSFKQPYLTAPTLSRGTQIPLTTCKRYLERLSINGVLEERGIFKKQKVFINRHLIDILKSI